MDNLQRIRFEDLKKSASGSWAERILAQLGYAIKLSEARDGKFDGIIEEAVKYLHRQYEEEGVLSKASALKAEDMISSMSADAKALRIICAAHAHIDMNWLWGFAETAAVTLDTFRTMLNIMNEYPEFTFSQSQASVYSIVEEYDPDMLEEIKARVKEGRWEVTASTWVETDKNMPNGESLARHILYTKKYLSRLLDIRPDSLALDFEPDTFGHNANVPEIMTKGGVKYYYHCRGYDGYNLYRWQSPSGSSVIVYREPLWYNATIDSAIAQHVPDFCRKHGVDAVLKVYGVGDHGGGPTRRDIEKLLEMSAWPVFPAIKFGTFAEYFSRLESISEKLPVVDHELNFIFSGCYTTQTRIKLANRISEAKLNEAELFSSFSSEFAGGKYPGSSFEEAWKKVLFNHFHDIIPGSGVIETREYAMGQFQQVLAAANTSISKALRNIAAQVDTSALPVSDESLSGSISEGAGVGFGIYDYGVPQTERGAGKSRIYHLFNPSAYNRSEIVEITVWDWPGDMRRIEVLDKAGKPVKYQAMAGHAQQFHQSGDYWGHKYMKLAVNAEIPACGYTTYLLHEKDTFDPVIPHDDPRVEKPYEYILENGQLKAVFSVANGSVLSLVDKKTGREMVDPKRPAGVFRLIDEDDSKGMTAWVVGRYMNRMNIDKDVKISGVHFDSNALRQWIAYDVKFRSSALSVVISLDQNSSRLDFQVNCDWQERAEKGKSVPQLNFYMPLAYNCNAYQYDIPFGTIVRTPLDMDVPAGSWALGMPENTAGSGVMLVSGTKYGFRCTDDSISLTLIRSSYDPDPYPENGIHKFGFAVKIAEDCSDNTALIKSAYDYNHPVSFISGKKHSGKLSAEGSFMSLEGGTVAVSAVKLAEDMEVKSRMVVRVYETSGTGTTAVLKFARAISDAWLVDINENKLEGAIQIKEDTVSFNVGASSMVSLCVEL